MLYQGGPPKLPGTWLVRDTVKGVFVGLILVGMKPTCQSYVLECHWLSPHDTREVPLSAKYWSRRTWEISLIG